MKRRLIAAVAAVVLASVGAILLLNYVAGADKRAASGMKTTTVLVVAAPVAKGTSAKELGDLVIDKTMPVNAVAPGAVSSLEEISGQVATVDLQPGEQLLDSRFADPRSLTTPGEVKVPAGMQQVTVQLDAPRVLGGNISPGATVAVYVSFADPKETNLALDKVLVSRVQGGITPAPPKDSAAAPASTSAPASASASGASVMVTLVVAAADAQKLIYGAEHGTIWLSLETADGQ